MQRRLFTAKTSTKTDLDVAVSWHTSVSETLRKEIMSIGVNAFIDAYEGITEETLGLKAGMTKKRWLTNMMVDAMQEFDEGNLSLAVATLDGHTAGFLMCSAAKADRQTLKTELYLDLLAIKPMRRFTTDEKVQVGVGKRLIESLIAQHPEASNITLDTRVINTTAKAFYTHLGFKCTGEHTFSGLNPKHYTGFDKTIERGMQDDSLIPRFR